MPETSEGELVKKMTNKQAFVLLCIILIAIGVFLWFILIPENLNSHTQVPLVAFLSVEIILLVTFCLLINRFQRSKEQQD